MTIRKMTKDDIEFLDLPEEWMRERYVPFIESNPDNAFIIEDKGERVCAFGASKYWTGVYEVWFNLMKKTKTTELLLMVKKKIEEHVKVIKARRIFATVKCGYKIGMDFVDFLGFEFEGKLHKWNPDGSDAFMFARVF